MNLFHTVSARFMPIMLCLSLLSLLLTLAACSDDGGEQPVPAPIAAEPAAMPTTASAPLADADRTPPPVQAPAIPPAEPQRSLTPTPPAAAIPATTAAPAVPNTASTAAPTVTNTPSSGESATAASSSIPTAIPAEAPPLIPTDTAAETDSRRGGTLNLVSRQVIPHFDVQADVSPALAAWGPGIAYSRLMRFSGGDGVALPSLAVQCEICSDWQTTDGITFDFTLRDDALWQDLHPLNGRRLVAQDIVYSYERQRAPSMPNGALLHIVDTIDAPAADKLRITLLAPDADFLAALADGHSKIVAREAVEISGNLRNGPTVGSGAWIFEQEDATYTFRRNPAYFKPDAPLLDRIRIHTITDADTAYAAFRVNNLDVHRLRPAEWDEFRQQKPDAALLTFRETGVGMEVAFKTTTPPFDDLRIRRAAMLAMRPNSAITDIWQDAAYPTQGVPLGRADWHMDADELAGYFDDTARSTALLVESANALPVPVVITAGDFGAEYRAHAERIAAEMQSVGFAPQIEIVDRRQFGERVWLGGEYQMFVGPTAPAVSPNGYMLAVLSSGGLWNTTAHADERLDALILAQAGEYDIDERRRIVREVQRHVMDNAYRFMPAAAVSLWAAWPGVQGFAPNFAASEYSHWERVWLQE